MLSTVYSVSQKSSVRFADHPACVSADGGHFEHMMVVALKAAFSLRASTPGRPTRRRRALTSSYSRTRRYANYLGHPPAESGNYKMSDSEEDLALIGLYLISHKRRQRKRRFWVDDVIYIYLYFTINGSRTRGKANK